MKIILMGQQAFGKSALEKFHTETDHEVVAVYCAPDKEGKQSILLKNTLKVLVCLFTNPQILKTKRY